MSRHTGRIRRNAVAVPGSICHASTKSHKTLDNDIHVLRYPTGGKWKIGLETSPLVRPLVARTVEGCRRTLSNPSKCCEIERNGVTMNSRGRGGRVVTSWPCSSSSSGKTSKDHRSPFSFCLFFVKSVHKKKVLILSFPRNDNVRNFIYKCCIQ